MLMHVQRLCIFSENQSADVSNEKETERCEWVVLYLCQLSTALRNVNSKTANSTSNNDFNIVWKVCTQGTLEREQCLDFQLSADETTTEMNIKNVELN